MVLIITSSFDETVNFLLKKYKDFNNNTFRLNVDKLEEYEIDIYGDYWKINHNYCCISDIDVTSIYYRKPTIPDISSFDLRYHYLIQRDIIALVNGIVDAFNGVVISKPCILRKVENKIYQLIYAYKFGWKLPCSYIGNSNKECEIWLDNDNIIKPISIGMTKNEIDAELYHTNFFNGFLNDVSLTPVYLQKYIEKKYEVRVTVVDKRIFAVRIDTIDKLDWRKDYENHKYSIINCPKDIESKCLGMLKDFNLLFGAFDFIVTPENEWIFLELNPNGQWLWLEMDAGINISSYIVEKLLQNENN
ncbi:MAG: hypothetical protein J6O41_04290 [Clostridia bacterium]|nr:hypothetical protein [Clostridia bacterium]